MKLIEETIDATLDSNGQLRLTHQPLLPPGGNGVPEMPQDPAVVAEPEGEALGIRQ